MDCYIFLCIVLNFIGDAQHRYVYFCCKNYCSVFQNANGFQMLKAVRTILLILSQYCVCKDFCVENSSFLFFSHSYCDDLLKCFYHRN